MKIIHLVAIIVSMSFILFVTGHAYAQCVDGSGINCSNYPPLNDLGDGNPFFMTVKGSFLPGQLVEISGNLVTVDPVQIVLDNPQGMMKASKTTFSDRDGYFASELQIPADAKAGNWTIVGTSGIYHKKLNFTILGNSDTVTCYAGNLCSKPIVNATAQYDPKTTVSIGMKLPMEQFKSGIDAQDVKCRKDLMLVIKTTDGSPACVKPLTYNKLALQGWAKLQGVTTTTYVTVGNSTYDIPYIMRGWTNKLMYITANTTQNSLEVFVESTAQKGEITLTIPRALLDSKNAYSHQDSKFVILVDKQEIKYTETTSITARTLTIPFDFGAKEIEIIATTGI